ncbi:hypothetical protein D0869_14759 [Hortaea werneckii]|uniref:Uncharacterized protein n=1 Tax=Hortaea werneckii TaxID=91943 RepID=A0A3M6W1B2_HORWE|nr:hypothetical protein D0869_14759 [Hortaea werneckii]
MSTSWLNKQRKQTLLDLSSEAGLDQPDDARKDSIVSALDTFLQANASRLSQNAAFEPYFGPRSRTPFKARSSSAAGNATSDDGEGVKSVVRGRGRRATRVKEEFDSEEPALSSPAPVVSPTAQLIPQSRTTSKRRPTTTTTPASASRSSLLSPTNQPRLPASPADVANFAEYETSQIYAGLSDFYTLTGLPRTLDSLRETCSSLSGIQGFFMLLETFSLHRVVLPWIYSGLDLPLPFLPDSLTTHRGGFLPRKIELFYPDLFQLLSSDFWFPTLLWSSTSLLLPALAAYFFNLTLRPVHRRASGSSGGGVAVTVARYTFDPLMFNVVKAIATWMVYSRGVGMGGRIGEEVVGTVEGAMWGGYQGVLVGCYVCVLASVYEAVLRK